jgi:hypothetical protein
MFKSVKDGFYILIINIVRIEIKGLLPVQCTVIHFFFTCDKAFDTNLSPNTDSWFLLYLDSYGSIRRFVICLMLSYFSLFFAIILLITEFHTITLFRKKLMENSWDACVHHIFLILADTGGFAMFMEQLYEPTKR